MLSVYTIDRVDWIYFVYILLYIAFRFTKNDRLPGSHWTSEPVRFGSGQKTLWKGEIVLVPNLQNGLVTGCSAIYIVSRTRLWALSGHLWMHLIGRWETWIKMWRCFQNITSALYLMSWIQSRLPIPHENFACLRKPKTWGPQVRPGPKGKKWTFLLVIFFQSNMYHIWLKKKV